MKAILNDNTIIELKKECGCKTHDGPHWLHMDRLWKDSNRTILNSGNVWGFVFQEQARLREKQHSFELMRIKELINIGARSDM